LIEGVEILRAKIANNGPEEFAHQSLTPDYQVEPDRYGWKVFQNAKSW
jgi:hypothetical protein